MSGMKNLDQIRAGNALEAGKKGFKGVNDGQVVKKIPTMIRENGLLGALAFAVERKDGKNGKPGDLKNPGHHGVFAAIVTHLAHPGIGKIGQQCTPEQFAQWLTESEKATSARLRDITSESLAYLNYLRRFAGKHHQGESHADTNG